MKNKNIDFTYFYKDRITDYSKYEYDFFISAFDNCERTKKVYANIQSTNKKWLIFPQHHIKNEDLPPSGSYYTNTSLKEDDYFQLLFEEINFKKIKKLCIDTTGFIRPHLLFLLKYLHYLEFKKIDFIYSEPIRYIHSDETSFSGLVSETRIIEGYTSSNNNPNKSNDVLIVNLGYDDQMIEKVFTDKSRCEKKYCILGFPSLQPDFYQESVLKKDQAKVSVGEETESKFAPAYDPFVTAQVLLEIVKQIDQPTNIYLSPLSSKAQTIGMGLFYIWYESQYPLNIIFPFSDRYSNSHAEGIGRTWLYTFELP